MSNTELLLKKVEGIPPDYMPQIFDFIDQLKYQAPPLEKVRGSKLTHEEFAKDLAEIRRLGKDSTLTVDGFLEERWKDRDLEEAEYRE